MNEPHVFISYLQTLRDNRGALAALRRGMGQPPGTAREMYPYVVRWLPNDVSTRREAAYYLIASFFAYHPDAGGYGSLGDAFRRARTAEGDGAATERRFTALLTAHPDDLPFYLRQAISFLKSQTPSIPVNWNQLFSDILAWAHPAGYVQKQWARDFWGHSHTEETATKEN
ncbi:MAG: type I-E CRISPR-associated protein Cse2/CasB [Anaerolineae bacterium]